ncbi:hypothetical protein [Mycolicibacterium sp. CBM1]
MTNQAAAPDEQPATSDAPEASGEPTAPVTPEPAAAPQPAPAARRRSWSMPKSPVNRQQADQVGRSLVQAIAAVGKAIATAARFFARTVQQVWRAIEAVPPAVQAFGAAAILMLLGIVGAITLADTVGLVCTVVVIPVCAATLGALGHRWYSGLGAAVVPSSRARPLEPAASDLQRSVEYVDKKLALALSSFGTDHHQQAVIALFQAKTAVELTLGTEQDAEAYSDVPLRADDYGLRPRIRAGSGAALREGNSLAAS